MDGVRYDGCGDWEHSNVCYVHVLNQNKMCLEWVPVEYTKTIKNEYDLDLFEVTRDVVDEKGHVRVSRGSITEGSCGLKVCNAGEFETCIAKYGVDKVKSSISHAVEKNGWSPRYTHPDETKVEVFGTKEKKHF